MDFEAATRAVVGGYHHDPFAFLGYHERDGHAVVRAYLPDAERVVVLERSGREVELERVNGAGVFAGEVAPDCRPYQLKARFGGHDVVMEDAYRFPPILSDLDLYLLGEGTHLAAYDKLGAHPMTLDGVDGVGFVVLAPNARRVSVVGDFNFWDGRRHAMRVRGNGYWEIFVPGASVGSHYKFEVLGPHGHLLPQKADPFAFAAEVRPKPRPSSSTKPSWHRAYRRLPPRTRSIDRFRSTRSISGRGAAAPRRKTAG